MTLAIIAAAGSRSSTLRRLVIDTLSERLDSDVQLETFSVDFFPTVDVRGEGLVVQLRGHADMPPLLKIRGFVIKGGLFGLLSRPRKFSQITLDGLEINIPPGGSDFADHYNRAASPESADQRSSSPLHIEQLESHGCRAPADPEAGREAAA